MSQTEINSRCADITRDLEYTAGRLSAERRARLLSSPSRQGKGINEFWWLAATLGVAVLVAFTLGRMRP